MAEARTTVERALGGADVRPITLDAFHTRRQRKRRNQRLAAGALGVSIALAVALIASQIALERERTGDAPTDRNGIIAFQGDRGLFLSDPDGTSYHKTMQPPDPPGECLVDRAHPCNFEGLSWSPDGAQLAFVFGDPSVGLLGDMSIYVMDAATEEVRLLTRCPARPGDNRGECDNGQTLSWSPDGERIVFSSGSDLFVVDSASGELSQITGCPSCAYEGRARHPSWAPAGELIAFSGQRSIDVVRSDGTEWRTVVGSLEATFDPLNGNPLEWSPDGTKLAFVALEGMFVVNADGSGLELVVDHNPDITSPSPSWSPDGQKIVYLMTLGSGDAYRAQVRIVDVTGDNDRVLYRSGCCIHNWRSPLFSPDGTMIAFSLGVEDGFYVFVMDADGGDVHRIPGFGEIAWQALPR
jgi:Tol biopolymer transport system component